MNVIAKREAIAENLETSERGDITFEISEAYTDDNGQNYFCTVRISGVEQEETKVGGLDSLQAVFLAVTMLKDKFKELKSDKYKFYFLDGEYEMDSLDYGDIIEKFMERVN